MTNLTASAATVWPQFWKPLKYTTTLVGGFLLLLSLPALEPASAARIEVGTRPPCGVLIKGQIESGDAARLREALEKAESHEYDVCLDSPGGSFAEGVKMIDAMVDKSELATFIDNGSECQSVCAYIFMAGRRDFHHGTIVPKRTLHVGGKLGFHIVPVRAEGSTLTKDAIEQIYREGVRTVGALVKQNAKSGQQGYRDQMLPYPKALVSDALTSEPNKLLAVDTVEKAGRYGIDLVGYRLPPLTTVDLRRACVFYSRWNGPIFGSPLNYKDMSPPGIKAEGITLNPGETRQISLSQFGPNAEKHCVVDLWQSRTLGLIMHFDFDNGPKAKKKRGAAALFKESASEAQEHRPIVDHPAWYTFSPETRLVDLIAR